MNVLLLNKIKSFLKTRARKFILCQIFIICFTLVSCQEEIPEIALETRTTPPFESELTIISETPIATIMTSGIPTLSIVNTPSPTSTQIISSPASIPIIEATATVTPTVSFDTDEILFYGAIIDSKEYIYSLQPRGSSELVLEGRLLSGQPYSPDETMLIIDTNDWSNPPLSSNKVFIFNLKTRETLPLNLLAHPRGGIFWSRDGSSLLYIDKDSSEDIHKLLLYDILSGENKVLVEGNQILFTAGWSIDGETIAFVSEVNGQYDLFTVNSKTLEQQQLSNDPEIETLVRWSPTAPQLLVGNVLDERSTFEGWPWGIESLYLVNSENNYWEKLMDKSLSAESFSWSPDGKQIVFSDAGLLCIKNLETMIDDCPLANSPPYNEYFMSFAQPPVWSSDGKWLAVQARKGRCYVIHFLQLETTTVLEGDLGCDILSNSSMSPIYWMDSLIINP